MKRNSSYMKKLREVRIIRGECIRCGNKLTAGENKSCTKCCQYLKEYRKKGKTDTLNTTYYYDRLANKDRIKRQSLHEAIVKNKISIKDLANKTGITTRTISRILYTNEKYSVSTQKKINDYFGESVI